MNSIPRRSAVALMFAALLAVTGLAGCYGKKLTFGKGEVFYKDPVTEAEATKLGNFLKDEVKYFDDTNQKSVQVVKEGDTYVVKFVVKEGSEKDNDVVAAFGMVGAGISSEVFGGAKVQVDLADTSLKTLKSLPAAAASH